MHVILAGPRIRWHTDLSFSERLGAMRVAAAMAGLLGGLCWVGSFWVDVLVWPGAALLTLAVLAAGAGLVSRSAIWLRFIVAVCFVALVGSVLQVLLDNVDDDVVLAAAGGIAVVVAMLVLARRRPEPVQTSSHAARRARGSHSR
jgi:hypothetical protein